VKDSLDIQLEISKLEKESIFVENTLMDKESELKIWLKVGNKSPNEIIGKRKEVEKLRQSLQNIQTQLGNEVFLGL